MNFRTIKIDELAEISDRLAAQIRFSGYLPRHILYIEKAGWLLGNLLQERLGGTVGGISVSRPGGQVKKLLGPLLPFFPRATRKTLRSIELKCNENHTKRDIGLPGNTLDSAGPVLLVDDAIDSGYSVLSVINFLLDKGISRTQIRVAVINTTNSARVVDPDYVCFQNTILSFPWSRDSSENKSYHELRRLTYSRRGL